MTLADVAPTVDAAARRRRWRTSTASICRRRSAARALPRRELYAESFAPLVEFGWAPLRSIRSGPWKLIAAPKPELFDIEQDPGEQTNLAASQPSRSCASSRRAPSRYSPARTCRTPRRSSAEAAERLRALGYSAGSIRNPQSAIVSRARSEGSARAGRAHRAGHLRRADGRRARRGARRHRARGSAATARRTCVWATRGCRPATARAPSRSSSGRREPGCRPRTCILGLATCLGRRRDLAGAERALDEARRLEPDNPSVIANLGLPAGGEGQPAGRDSGARTRRSRSIRTCTRRASTSRWPTRRRAGGPRRQPRHASCSTGCPRTHRSGLRSNACSAPSNRPFSNPSIRIRPAAVPAISRDRTAWLLPLTARHATKRPKTRVPRPRINHVSCGVAIADTGRHRSAVLWRTLSESAHLEELDEKAFIRGSGDSAAHLRVGVRAADDGNHHRSSRRPAGRRDSRRDRHGEERGDRLHAHRGERRGRASTACQALPVGIYEVTAELQGFATVSKKDIEVNVAQTQAIDFPLKVASLAETVNVTGATPLIETTASSVGAVVDVKRIENMPLNGRQFANLAATVPGVGLGFHSDPTKSTQYAPHGQRRRRPQHQLPDRRRRQQRRHRRRPAAAVPARSDRAVQLPDAALQGRVRPQQRRRPERRHQERHQQLVGQRLRVLPRQVDERAVDRERDRSPDAATKQDYRRNQFGGSFGGPIAKDKAHFFAAIERTQQDTTQVVNTQGLFPTKDGVFAVPYRENLVHRQGDGEPERGAVPVGPLRPQQQLAAVRRGASTARSTTGATARTSSTRSTSTTTGCWAGRS